MIRLSDHFDVKRLIRFTLPSIVMMIFTSIYCVVDGYFVSNFAGKTPFAAVLISTLCTIVPMFLPTSRVSGVFNKLLCLLPAKAMDTHIVFSTYVLFSFGKLVIILPCMILIAACALIIVTLPVAHRKFCRHQVA